MERKSDTMTSITSMAGLTPSPPMSKWMCIHNCAKNTSYFNNHNLTYSELRLDVAEEKRESRASHYNDILEENAATGDA